MKKLLVIFGILILLLGSILMGQGTADVSAKYVNVNWQTRMYRHNAYIPENSRLEVPGAIVAQFPQPILVLGWTLNLWPDPAQPGYYNFSGMDVSLSRQPWSVQEWGEGPSPAPPVDGLLDYLVFAHVIAISSNDVVDYWDFTKNNFTPGDGVGLTNYGKQRSDIILPEDMRFILEPSEALYVNVWYMNRANSIGGSTWFDTKFILFYSTIP